MLNIYRLLEKDAIVIRRLLEMSASTGGMHAAAFKFKFKSRFVV